jgi:hypothetical protein
MLSSAHAPILTVHGQVLESISRCLTIGSFSVLGAVLCCFLSTLILSTSNTGKCLTLVCWSKSSLLQLVVEQGFASRLCLTVSTITYVDLAGFPD